MDAGRPVVRTAVTLTVWGIRPRRIPAAIARMSLDRRQLREAPGLRFAKLLGTGDGRTFTLRDADPLHWALLTVWDNVQDATEFAGGKLHQSWNRICDERLDVLMSPLASRGHWAGKEPFGPVAPGRLKDPPAQRHPTEHESAERGYTEHESTEPESAEHESAEHESAEHESAGPGYTRSSPLKFNGRTDLGGPVASITRARLRPSRAVSFWRAVPPVSADLTEVDGLGLAIGIGEAPLGVQGTFSLWRTPDALNDFAYRRAAHREVINRTPEARWYAEELFARFAVQSVDGTFAGRRPLAD